jgi:hypothetical protein
MQRVSIRRSGLEGLAAFFRGVVRSLQGLAIAAVVGVAAIAAALARDGVEASDVFVTIVLLAAPGVVLFFAAGLRQVLQLPDRLRSLPGEGSDQLAELTRIAAATRGGGIRRAPGLLWRLRGVVGSSRDLVGIALPLKIFTPGFLGLAALAAAVSLFLIGAGLIALIVLVAG